MSDKLKAELVSYLDEMIAGMKAEVLRIPRTPENLALFIQAGNNIAAIEILKSHLTE